MDTLPVSEIERLDPALDLFEDGPGLDPDLVVRGLHPPLPVAKELLVWGFRVCRQARRLRLAELPCLFLPPMAGVDLLGMALRLEARAGRYSWDEKERMVRYVKARRAMGESIELGSLSPWIEGRPEPQIEARIARFADLPPGAKHAVTAGRLDLKTALLATGLPPEVLDLATRSRLSFSQRRQFLAHLREVGRRDGLTPEDLAALAGRLLRGRGAGRSSLRGPGPDPGRGGRESPLEALAALRFPRLTGLRDRFAALARSHWKGSGIRIDPPPYFEGEGFAVGFRFSSPENLRRKLRILRIVAEHADELFELLR